jgi:hypothetical protein
MWCVFVHHIYSLAGLETIVTTIVTPDHIDDKLLRILLNQGLAPGD